MKLLGLPHKIHVHTANTTQVTYQIMFSEMNCYCSKSLMQPCLHFLLLNIVNLSGDCAG